MHSVLLSTFSPFSISYGFFFYELNILKKAIPKLWKETLITQDSIKTQVIPKQYVKIAKNQIQNLQIKNKEVYKILLESQLKEKPIAYTKWEKCLKKDRMHTLNIKLSKFILNMRKFSPIFSKYFCGIIFQFSLLFSNNLNIHFICKAFI
jgi:hypothetical protein